MFKKCMNILLFCVLIVFVIGFSNNHVYGSGNIVSQNEEISIVDTIIQVAKDENREIVNFKYTAKYIYFSNEKIAGYVIDFISNNEAGYGIFFNYEDDLKLIELFFGKSSPYHKVEGMPIYISLGYYFIKKNGKVFEISDNNYKGISNIENEYFGDEAIFFGSNNKAKDKDGKDETITITYDRGYKYGYEIPNFYVSYGTSLTNHNNNCANAAGLILVNYWNKKTNNDLLKIESSLLSNSNISYNSTTDARKELMGKFYDYMNTNWLFGTGGTLPGDAYKGFEKLIKENQYKVKRETNLTYDGIVEKIKGGTPVMITSTDYYYSNRNNRVNLPTVNGNLGTHSFNIDYEHTWGIANAHTFIAYGYAYYSLYKTVEKSVWSPVWYNPFRYVNKIETENFQEQLVKVANGWGGSCYFNYNRSDVFSNAAINVYK